MRFKAKQIHDILEHIRYTLHVPIESANIDITIREEDLETNKLVSCLVMVVTYEAKPGQYSMWRGIKYIKHTLEVFPESEGARDIHITTEESYDLPEKR